VIRRALRNALVRHYGNGIPADMTRTQLEARVAWLRAHGKHFEALDLLRTWLSAPKGRRP
jgi:hypothetical protein